MGRLGRNRGSAGGGTSVGDVDAGTALRPTHRVGDAPLQSFERPDAASVLPTWLDPRLEVCVTEQRADGWAHVLCSNGWTTWVDGRLLAPLGIAGPVAA